LEGTEPHLRLRFFGLTSPTSPSEAYMSFNHTFYKSIGYKKGVQRMSALMRYPPWCTSTSVPSGFIGDISSVSHPFGVTPLLLRIGRIISSQTSIEKRRKTPHP